MQTRDVQKFGRFCLLRRIALGGMAEIWLAAERRIDDDGQARERTLVIKRILPHYAESPEFVAYFVNEGSIGTRLHHANIIETYELGQIDGQYFLAMEYVKGASLLDVLRQSIARGERLPLGFAVDVVLGAARGLAYAHSARDDQGRPLGIVHRDVSPHNILLGFDGAVKVVDFGVAKAASQLHHTRTGTIKGKLSYVAPEQVSGAAVDARTDVFALGIVLHEAIACRQLFKGQNEAETLAKVLRGPIPPLHAVRPDCPPELDRIAMRALARKPGDRYPSADEMAEDLSHVRAFLEDPADVVPQKLAALFPQELEREDPKPPTGSWTHGEVISREPTMPRRSRATSAMMAISGALAVAAMLTLAQRRASHEASTQLVAAAAPMKPQPLKLEPDAIPAPTPPPVVPEKPVRRSGRVHAPAHVAAAPAPAAPSEPGRLRVIVEPWAEVSVDGKAAGMTPSPPLAVAPGVHTVTLRNSDLGREVKRRVTVPSGGEAVLRVDLFHP